MTKTHEAKMNHIHLSACFNNLGRLAAREEKDWRQRHGAALASLAGHAKTVVSTSSDIRARELANIAHGLAKSGLGPEMPELMSALGGALKVRVAECNSQELANAAWAFAKAGRPDEALFSALSKSVKGRVSDFNSQELTNVAWAFATAKQTDGELFAALASAVSGCLTEFTEQGLSNTALAFAKAGHLEARLFEQIAKLARQRLDR